MTLKSPSLNAAWISVARAASSQAADLSVLMSTPEFDVTMVDKGYTLPLACLDAMVPAFVEQQWPGPDWPSEVSSLIIDLLNRGAPSQSGHPLLKCPLLDLAVASGATSVVDFLLSQPCAPTVEALMAKMSDIPVQKSRPGGPFLPWLHACVATGALEVFDRLVIHGLGPMSLDAAQRSPPFYAKTPEVLDHVMRMYGHHWEPKDSGRLMLAWVKKPPQFQKEMRAVLDRHCVAPVLNQAELVISQLLAYPKLTSSIAKEAMAAVPQEDWSTVRFEKAAENGKVSWGAVGWMARCLLRTGQQWNRDPGTLTQNVRCLLRSALASFPGDAWTHESLPGVPDGVLMASALRALSPGSSWRGNVSLEDLSDKSLEKALPHVKKLTLKSVWQALLMSDSELQRLKVLSPVYREQMWERAVGSLKNEDFQNWPWQEINQALKQPKLRKLIWDVPNLYRRLPKPKGEAASFDQFIHNAGPDFWDVLVISLASMKSKGSEDRDYKVWCKEALLKWAHQDENVLNGIRDRTQGPAACEALFALKDSLFAPLQNKVILEDTLPQGRHAFRARI